MGLRFKVPIFADTNLGTHIALDVNPFLKASELKRELEEAHLNCFPKLGKIRINGLTVKRKSNFYHLPDSLCIKHVFQDFGGLWFVHIKACLLSEIVKSTSNPSDIMLSTEPRNCVSNSTANYTNQTTEIKGTKRILCPKIVPSSIGLEKGNISRNVGGCTKGELGKDNKLSAISTNDSEAVSVVVSVSGIINKYFRANKEEILNSEMASSANHGQYIVQSNTINDDDCSKKNINEERQFTPKTPKRTLNFSSGKSSRAKISKHKCEVGKRLLVASTELGRFKSSRKSLSGLYSCKGQKSSGYTYSSLCKSLVFEMSDEDE